MYDPRQGEDIKQFIGRVNGLADQAKIVQTERKSTLNDRVPAYMGPGLLTQSKDPNVTYEAFCRYVADAASERKAKAALRDDRPARRKSHGRQPTVKKEARVEETYRSGHREPDRARSDTKRDTHLLF
ncbi:hypothetical protein E4U58_003645, partial [Claviceps cyperi]